MSEMIERVARALWDKQYPTGTSWDDWARHVAANPEGFDGRDACRELARAAIAAMGPVIPITDWLKRHSDYRNSEAYVRTNPAYFAQECAAAITAALRDA